MDLRLIDESARNTVIILPDSSPLYQVETRTRWLSVQPTSIKKIDGAQAMDMAVVQIPMGLDITPVRQGLMSTSETFIASDGKSYKWKVEMGDLYLNVNDGSHTTIAIYDPGSLGFFSKMRAPTLTVTPQGMHIGDDIVATFIYMLQQQQRRRRRRNNR
ncbi:hypothetical protein BDZ89DRAFT_1057496 [Hymenopellis radicata]|nr:hypothetical protein BDZ89DRAFT_1057496 [Hymenopellis radicata]